MRFPIAMSLKGKSTEAGALEESGSPILKLLSPRRHYDPRRTACRRVAMFDQLGLRFGTLDALGVKSRLVVASDVPRTGRQAHSRRKLTPTTHLALSGTTSTIDATAS